MAKGTLSLMIVAKNEQADIGECIKSVKNIIDEIVVIDTGSTDKTVDIAKELGAKVFFKEWNDDFASIKNFGISNCTQDWILSLDCDERIESKYHESIMKLMEKNDKTEMYNIPFENIQAGEEDPVGHTNYRLFPRVEKIKFLLPIHEGLDIRETNVKGADGKGIVITHLGYQPSYKVRKNTDERNLRILLKCTENPEAYKNTPAEVRHLNYYIGQQYLIKEDWVKAEEYYLKAYNLLKGQPAPEPQIYIPLIFNALARVYIMWGQEKKIEELAKKDVAFPSFYLEIGSYYTTKGDYERGIRFYELAIEKKYTAPRPSVVESGIFTWKPYVLIADAYEKCGEIVKAIDNYKLALWYNQKLKEILRTLMKLFARIGSHREASDVVNRLLLVDNSNETQIDYANVLMNLGKKEEAIKLFFKYATVDQLLQLRGYLINFQDFENADKVWKELLDEKKIKKAPYRKCKDMFTVIIPTLLKSNKDVFDYALKQLNQCEIVKEIIVIDNTKDKEFTAKMGRLPKVNVIDDQPNLFVNGAWNYAMNLVDTPYYLLLNDDILLTEKAITDCYNLLEEEKEVGIVSITQGPMQDIPTFERDSRGIGQFGVTTYFLREVRIFTGWFIAGRKEDWKPIPEGINIFFGDNWIYWQNEKNKKKFANIISSYIVHYTSTTVNSLKLYQQGLLQKEELKWKEIVEAE